MYIQRYASGLSDKRCCKTAVFLKDTLVPSLICEIQRFEGIEVI